MKYLKLFEELQTVDYTDAGVQRYLVKDELKLVNDQHTRYDTINDIAMELEDEGFEVKAYEMSYYILNYKIIKREQDNDEFIRKIIGFKYDEVEDCVERIKDYMESEGFTVKIEKSKKYGIGSTLSEVLIKSSTPE